MEIRLLTAADVESYSELRLEALEREEQAFSSSVEQHRTLTAEELKSRLGPGPDNFVVGAFDGKRLVGTAGFYRDQGRKTRHKGHVWGVYLTLHTRGKGEGRNLMQALLRQATHVEGIEQVQLSVTTTQVAAAGLYRSLGFETFAQERQALKTSNGYLDEEYMVLFVNHPHKP